METQPIAPAEALELASEMTKFFSSATSMGSEVAFWRAKTSGGELQRFQSALVRLNQSTRWIGEIGHEAGTLTDAFSALRQKISALVAQVPFDKRVNLLHRSLISAYQQIYILDNLVAALLARLKQHEFPEDRFVPQAGSLLGMEARREMRAQFQEIVPSWDRRDWDLYDGL